MYFLYIKGKNLPYMSSDSGLATSTSKEAQPIPTPSKTCKHIGMDLICNFYESQVGYKHILVTVCYLRKYVAVRPLELKISEEVTDIIQHDQWR